MFLFGTLDENLSKIVVKLNELMGSFWKYAIAALILVIVVWGIYVGIKIITAHKNDEKINAKGMLKSLLIGVIVIFVIAVGAPLLIKGLEAWVGNISDLGTGTETTGFALFFNTLNLLK